MRLMSLPSFPPKKMFTIQNKLTETYYFPICLSQSCTDFLAAVRLFCAVLPRTASPFSSVAPLHVERMLLSVPARELPSWVQNGMTVLPFLKIEQLNKVSTLEVVQFVRNSAHVNK